MSPSTRIKEAERMLRAAGAKVVRRSSAHTIWTLNGYRTLTARHSNAMARQPLLLNTVRQFIKKAGGFR